MKLERKRLTHKGYDEVILNACKLYIADYLHDDYLAKCYKQYILVILGIHYSYDAFWNAVPEPRWSDEGYKHCGKLWCVSNCIGNKSSWFNKSDLYYFCRQFVDWLYAECERDPSEDHCGVNVVAIDDNQKGESR